MIDKGKLEMVAQIINTLYDSYQKLKEAQEDKDLEELNKAKKEILNLKNKISALT